LLIFDFVIVDFAIKNHQSSITSLLCAAYASGNVRRTSSTPADPAWSSGSWSSNSSALYSHRTAS
jgi:hypothetical protein